VILIHSQHGFLWPAHGFEVKKGDNEYASIAQPVRDLLQPFIEGGLMTLVEDAKPEPTPAAPAKPSTAAIEPAPEPTPAAPAQEKRFGSRK
jgi:hypothetical protein